MGENAFMHQPLLLARTAAIQDLIASRKNARLTEMALFDFRPKRL